MKTFTFSQDLGDGLSMKYEVMGESAEEAQTYLESILKSGKLCDEDDENGKMLCVTRIETDGTETRLFSRVLAILSKMQR